jgi:hypothetical protein
MKMFSLTEFKFSVVSFVLACIVCWISILWASEDITCRIRINANIFSLRFPYMNRSDYICVESIVFCLYAFRKWFSLHWHTWIFQEINVTISSVYFFVRKLFWIYSFLSFFLKLTFSTKTVVWHVVEWCKFESEFTTLFWCKGDYLEAKNYRF